MVISQKSVTFSLTLAYHVTTKTAFYSWAASIKTVTTGIKIALVL